MKTRRVSTFLEAGLFFSSAKRNSKSVKGELSLKLHLTSYNEIQARVESGVPVQVLA